MARQARADGATLSEVRAALVEVAVQQHGDDQRPMLEAVAAAQQKWYRRAHRADE